MPDFTHSVITILIISIITILLRVGPAKIFSPEKETPPTLVYLGKVMPMAVISMLIIYCFRTIQFTEYPFGMAEIVASVVVIISYLYKRSTIISILLGVVIYMFFVQAVFV